MIKLRSANEISVFEGVHSGKRYIVPADEVADFVELSNKTVNDVSPKFNVGDRVVISPDVVAGMCGITGVVSRVLFALDTGQEHVYDVIANGARILARQDQLRAANNPYEST